MTTAEKMIESEFPVHHIFDLRQRRMGRPWSHHETETRFPKFTRTFDVPCFEGTRDGKTEGELSHEIQRAELDKFVEDTERTVIEKVGLLNPITMMMLISLPLQCSFPQEYVDNPPKSGVMPFTFDWEFSILVTPVAGHEEE